MNPFYYIYFNIYNSYFKDGKPRYNLNTPWFRATSSFAMCAAFWLFLLFLVIDHNYHLNIDSRIVVFSTLIIATIFYFIFHSIFVKNNKYEEIYRNYRHFDEKYLIIGRALSWVFIFMPILIMMLYSLIIHHKL